MGSQARSIFQTKLLYVASVFVASLGVVSLMWRFRGINWILVVFGVALVVVVTSFAWEIATRTEKLDQLVRARTDALAETNRRLSALLEQLNAFHTISYDITQKMGIEDITRAVADRLCNTLADVDSVWLWLDRSLLGTGGRGLDRPGPLELASQAGQDFGMPAELEHPRPDNPLVAGCFDERGSSAFHGLQDEALAWGWDWLVGSGMQSFVGFPMKLGTRMLGVLGVFSGKTMSAGFVSQLNLSVNQLTVALEKARLLKEMQKRAEELAAANEELRQLDAMKDWFVSAVSHELRTPLTSIRSFSEILENYESLGADEREEFAAIIRQESERLSEMIDEMLDVAKIADGEADLSPDYFDLPPLVDRCCKLFSQEANDRRIQFDQNVPERLPRVFADEKGVARVLNNLLGNAFKFTPDGGRVRVALEQGADGSDDAECVTVLVSDTGVGIAPKDQLRIFERFTQLGSGLTDKPLGTGIGLAICREIVAKSNGRIWVESEPGKGSTFGFALPVAPAK